MHKFEHFKFEQSAKSHRILNFKEERLEIANDMPFNNA